MSDCIVTLILAIIVASFLGDNDAHDCGRRRRNSCTDGGGSSCGGCNCR